MPKIQTNKSELIEICSQVFAKSGYYHTKFSDLSKACGIEKAHFYYYFKDKRDLMHECLSYYSEQIQKNVLDISKDEAQPPASRMRAMLLAWKVYASHQSGCLMGNTLLETLGAEPEFEETIRKFFDSWKKALVHLYSAGDLQGDLDAMALDDLEKIQGSIMFSRLYRDKSFLQRTVDQISARF